MFYDKEDLQRQIEEEMREDGEMKSKREIVKELLTLNVEIEKLLKK